MSDANNRKLLRIIPSSELGPADRQVIELIEDVLVEVKDGSTRGIAIVRLKADGSVVTAYDRGDGNNLTLLAGLTLLQWRVSNGLLDP